MLRQPDHIVGLYRFFESILLKFKLLATVEIEWIGYLLPDHAGHLDTIPIAGKSEFPFRFYEPCAEE